MLTEILEEKTLMTPISFSENFDLMDELNLSLITQNSLTEILCITTFPPRECGIATYSQDLITALNNKFSNSFTIKICPLESETEKHFYNDDIEYVLNTNKSNSFSNLAKAINANTKIEMVLIQHEFGLFEEKKDEFYSFLIALNKPVIIVFHTVLPNPNKALKSQVEYLATVAESIIVMTHSSQDILINDYNIDVTKIFVIAHGTHLVPHSNKNILKKKYDLVGKKVLSTFGLLSSGKSIETTLDALPQIIKNNEDVLFLVIGKTHPAVVKNEGEVYRQNLESKVEKLGLQQHVKFINQFLPLPELLEYLQLTDIYLFTSNNPNQAVSGTFSYAVSCGCPIVSTPIPHSREVLKNDAGIIFDFEDSNQLAKAVIKLLENESLRKNISSNGLHRMASTAWENSAIAHAMLFDKIANEKITLHYNIPEINLHHIKKLTTDFGIIQFAIINHPDIETGYTLDDNARALVAMCQHYELTKDESDLKYINIYLNFIQYCLQPNGNFLNYVNKDKDFTEQNNTTNLDDSNGRAIWALGYLISLANLMPQKFTNQATLLIQNTLPNITLIHSTRAMAFIIKGLYYSNKNKPANKYLIVIKEFANRMVQMYKHEQDKDWLWFESYLTYANSILPEAMLCAWLAIGEPIYKEIAQQSFDFLISKTFSATVIKVISNKTWLQRNNINNEFEIGGEQPIDVSYTILALSKFYDVFKDDSYLEKMEISFNWFLGNNHLKQIIYNPCTGGCYDGLEENYVNLNQGSESTVSYLMARFTIEKYLTNKKFNNYYNN